MNVLLLPIFFLGAIIAYVFAIYWIVLKDALEQFFSKYRKAQIQFAYHHGRQYAFRELCKNPECADELLIEACGEFNSSRREDEFDNGVRDAVDEHLKREAAK